MEEGVVSKPLDGQTMAPGVSGELRIDWRLAVPVSTAGTTCDTFWYEYNGRRIFIKRLKVAHEFNAVYRDSIRKEFEVGRMLEHAALPNYESVHGDTWLATRYVDGKTVSDILTERADWFDKSTNVVQLLAQLVDAVDYLHTHGVTHCDIHGGNVMIDRTGHVRLIDLGHCYTDWSPKSSANPSFLGEENLPDGSPQIDFRMIGQLTRQIISKYPKVNNARLKDFVAACQREDVSTEMLLEILNRKHAPAPKWWIGGAILAVIIATTAVLSLTKTESTKYSQAGISNDSTILIRAANTPDITQKVKKSAPTVENTPKPVETEPTETPATKTPTKETQATDMSSVMSEINAEITRYFQPLYADIRRLEELAMTETTDYRTLITESMEYADHADRVKSAVTQHLMDRFPGVTTNVICTSQAWIDYTVADHHMSELVSGEIKRRSQAQSGR